MIVVGPSADGTRIEVELGHHRWVATWLPEGRRPTLAALRSGTLKPWTIHETAILGPVIGTVGAPALASSRIGALTRHFTLGDTEMDIDDGRKEYDWNGIRIEWEWKGEQFKILRDGKPAGEGRRRWWTVTIRTHPESLEVPLALIAIGDVLKQLDDAVGPFPFA